MATLKQIAMWTGAGFLVLLFLGLVSFGFNRLNWGFSSPPIAHTHPAVASAPAADPAPAVEPSAAEELATASKAMAKAAVRFAGARTDENAGLAKAIESLGEAVETLKGLVK